MISYLMNILMHIMFFFFNSPPARSIWKTSSAFATMTFLRSLSYIVKYINILAFFGI